MDVDHASYRNIHILEQKTDYDECNELIDNLNLRESDRLHSFYKVAGHYFNVNYLISENGEYDHQSITIVNNKFEVIVVVIDIG